MHLEGQGGQRGYAMAALLVGVGVMMLLMTVAMPVWRHEMQREKEAELVFRGEQYARAINLYQRKMGPGNFPPSLDILVQQRFLRKKYKDPITGGDFQIIAAGQGIPQTPGQQPGQRGARGGGASTGMSPPPQTPGMSPPPIGGRSAQAPGGAATQPGGFANAGGGFGQFGEGGQRGSGIMGVASKSKDTAIRLYHGATHYNEWVFLFSNVSNRPGAPGGRGAPGAPGGQPGGARGNRGGQGGSSTPGIGSTRGGMGGAGSRGGPPPGRGSDKD